MSTLLQQADTEGGEREIGRESDRKRVREEEREVGWKSDWNRKREGESFICWFHVYDAEKYINLLFLKKKNKGKG